MNILAVMAHPDDEILGCGATLRRLSNEGHAIYAAILCSNADARAGRPAGLEKIARRAASMVGVQDVASSEFLNIQFNSYPHIEIVKAVEAAIRRFRPEVVFTHHPHDLNIDHRVCYEATMAAIMLPQRMTDPSLPVTMIREVYLCEILSSTDWALPTEPAFRPNTFVNIETTLETKIAALEEFEGAMKRAPHSRSIENVRHLASLRGAQVGLTAAEAFTLVRRVLI